MTEEQNPKRYDLEDRTLEFAKRVRGFVGKLSKCTANIEDGKQLIRASGFTFPYSSCRKQMFSVRCVGSNDIKD